MKRLPRNIHRLSDGRLWVYTTRKGRPVRNIISWGFLAKLKVPIPASTQSLQPGLALAKKALVKLQGVRLEEQRNGAIASQAKVKVASLLSLMEADYLHAGYKSWDDAKARYNYHLRPAFGDLLASEITTDLLNEYVKERLADKASNGSVNRELSVLRRMFKLAHAAGKLQNLIAFPHLSEKGGIRTGFLEQAEYDKLKSHAEPLWLRAILATAYSFGFRRSELLSMRCSQVSLIENTITLPDTKNGDPRVIAMTVEVRALIAACIEGKEPDAAVFTWADGREVRDFRETWRGLFVAAGVSPRLFHDLRRSACRNMIRRGVDRDVAMKVSGHKTDAIFRRYNIVAINDLKDAALKIAKGAAEATNGTTDNHEEGQRQPDVKVQ
jgi:integrase